MEDAETHLQRVRATSELEQKYWDGSGGGETDEERQGEADQCGQPAKMGKAVKSQRFLWPV